MADPASRWHPPADRTTRPDQLPPHAWEALDLFRGERVIASWRSARGFLVLTSLRCVLLWERREIFRPREWDASPQVFLYDARPPRVVLGRFVELESEADPRAGSLRAAVDDPSGVAAEIASWMPEARREWEQRRATVRRDLEAHRRRREEVRAALAAGRPIPEARAPCPYCGNLISTVVRICPFCGAPV